MTTENVQVHPVKKIAIIGGKVLGGAAIGYLTAKVIPPLFWLGVRRLNPYAQIPIKKFTPRHTRLGQGLMITGGIMQSPLVMGIGGGLIASDSDNSVLRKQEWAEKKSIAPKDFNMHRYSIPEWLPGPWKWNIVGDMLAELVTRPTFNNQRNEWIPPGREHPDVLNQARKIAHQYVLDGHDKVSVLKAIQRWVQDNITYVYDPRWLDTFAHPYLTLKNRAGDCDDQATLAASLGEALGIPMVMILLGQKDDTNYNHILSAGIVDKKLVPIETIPIEGFKANIGWIPPHIHKKIITLP